MPSSFSPREPDATGMAGSFASDLRSEIRATSYPARPRFHAGPTSANKQIGRHRAEPA